MSVKLRTPYHISLLQVGSPPPHEPGIVKLFVMDVSGSPELFVRDATGNDSQMTDGGVVTAGALLTLSGLVDVSGAAAPSVGQVLTALSPTTAEWQNIVATVVRLPQTTSTTPVSNTLCKQDVSGSAVTVNLPASHVVGDIIKVKMISTASHLLTVDANGSQTIDGQLTYVLVTDYECVTLESDGTNWLTTG